MGIGAGDGSDAGCAAAIGTVSNAIAAVITKIFNLAILRVASPIQNVADDLKLISYLQAHFNQNLLREML